MKIAAVAAAPDRTSLSFQVFHEVAAVLTMASHAVSRQDLYGDGFDPVLPREEIKRRLSLDPLVSRYAGELVDSEGILAVHPDWWGGPPAILKGWVDRVFSPGVAYHKERAFPGDRGEEQGLLSGKRALVISFSDNRADTEILRLFWEEKVFGWCGLEAFRLIHLDDVGARDYAEVADWKRRTIQDAVCFLTGASAGSGEGRR